MAKRITHQRRLITLAVLSTINGSLMLPYGTHAAELNTNVPNVSETGGFPVQINLPAQSLNQSIRQLANQTGLSISFDSELTKNKTAPAVKGFLSPQEALKKVLQGSGLQLNISGDSAVIKPEPEKNTQSLKLDAVEVRAKRFYEVGPLPGLGLTKEEIPGNVQSITAQEIKESNSLSITDLLNRKLQSVNVNDYQGNPFQMDVTYRGFTAGPQIGTPQGLSVFLDGIRVNEPFGEVVNWDMIPMNALAGVDVFPGSNPIFGLNTLGGAFAMKTKDGFNNAGFDANILKGSFDRKQLQFEAGWNNGTIGLFGAGNIFLEDGWRKNSPSRVNQLFGKASYRGDKLDLNLSTLLVQTKLVGNGLLPTQMYEQDRESVFTSPDTTKNKLSQFQLSGNYFVSDTFSVTGQVYRRNSDRRALGADVYTDGFGSDQYINRNLKPGEQFTCHFLSTNAYGLPNYYVISVPNGDISQNEFFNDYFTNKLPSGLPPDLSLANGPPGSASVASSFNQTLPDNYAAHAQANFKEYQNFISTLFFDSSREYPPELDIGPVESYSAGEQSYSYPKENYLASVARNQFEADPLESLGALNYFWTEDDPDGDGIGTKHYVMTVKPINADECVKPYDEARDPGKPLAVYADETKGILAYPDGKGFNGTGVVEGTPVALLTDNRIEQTVNGGSTQFNWNLEKHKFMVGMSLDSAKASYNNTQRLGLFDEDRNGFLAPDQIRDEYAAADEPISNNNFKGTSVTKSLYLSDTWTPVSDVHITTALRYNETRVKNQVATRTQGEYFDLAKYRAFPDYFDVCLGSIDNCPTQGYKPGAGTKLLKAAETEKFSFYSLNPSLGMTWQVRENVNVFANWAQGTRTPSVIELGCAFDPRPSGFKGTGPDKNGNGLPDANELVDIPISLAQNRSCTLPTTLAGDPFLPQIKATTYDIGVRGTIGPQVQWNLGAYQTDLKDDIYLVSVGAASSFFQTVGKTRRRGLEAGISGQVDRWGLGLNYSLTDATFQDTFDMVSNHNSSAESVFYNLAGDGESFKQIKVRPGDRMPGVPLHNLNANVSYNVTDQWRVSFGAVMHSEAFLRGNENNSHQAGVTEYYNVDITDANGNPINVTQAKQPGNNPGKVPGYTVFNFQTSYKLNKSWTASLIVNNVFDKEYFSAGRLGVNPFSPSIYGAIGPGGYNHNSDDWLSSSFLAPGAPRAAWFNLRYQFVAD